VTKIEQVRANQFTRSKTDGPFPMKLTLQQLEAHLWGAARLIPLSQVDQYLGLAGQIRNGAGVEFFGS
jgi:hypothetical protein